jgi:hypothetical protein
VTYNGGVDEASSNRSSSAAEAKVDGSDGASKRVVRRLLWLLFPLTLGLAITRQSLWVDEGYTAWFIAHKTISTFFSSLIGSPGAPGDPQMLFYLVYMWVWVKLFGESEWALRAANIPLAIVFMIAVSWAARRLLKQPNLWVFFCLSPFFWFYLNEARPYVALLTFSAVAIVALLAYLMEPVEYRGSAPWMCLIACILIAGTHILGVFLFASMAVVVVASVVDSASLRQNFLRDWYRPGLWCSPAFIALACFYVWASSYGVNRGHGRPGLYNLAYVLYEFLGFGGLGPPRGDIRDAPQLSVFSRYWPWLLLGIVAVLAVAFLLSQTRPPKLVWFLAGGLLVGAAMEVGVSIIEHFEVLGRHMAAFLPLLLLTLILWAKHSVSSARAGQAGTAAFVVLAVVWGISDLRLALLKKYQKDDYRGATSIALARARLDGGEILWAADPHTAYYYGIKVMRDDRSADIGKDEGIDWPVICEAVDAEGWSARKAAEYLKTSNKPIILVLSKTNPFDMRSAWHSLIQMQGPAEVAHLTAFSIYEWPAKVTARQ